MLLVILLLRQDYRLLVYLERVDQVIQAILVMLVIRVIRVLEILETTVVVEEAEAVVVPLLKVKNQVLIVQTAETLVNPLQTLEVAEVEAAVEATQLTLVGTKNSITNIPKKQMPVTLVVKGKVAIKVIKIMAVVVDLVVLVTQEILDKKLVLVIINSLADKAEMLVVETQAILETLAIKVMLVAAVMLGKVEMVEE
jgi:hypothetical protein|tara:strand:+ start:155 stop:745 length:591 start_codon:yes stop_codon:yes gene_type:complete